MTPKIYVYETHSAKSASVLWWMRADAAMLRRKYRIELVFGAVQWYATAAKCCHLDTMATRDS